MFLRIFAQVKFNSRSNSLVGRHDVYQILGADVESAKNVTQLVEYLSSIHKTYPKWYHDSVILAWGAAGRAGTGGSEVQGHSQPYGVLEASLGLKHFKRGFLILGRQAVEVALSDIRKQEHD